MFLVSTKLQELLTLNQFESQSNILLQFNSYCAAHDLIDHQGILEFYDFKRDQAILKVVSTESIEASCLF